ncbi:MULTISPECIES: hypothetical protein [unclassified Brevundimonas]|uniref:hypothetical protein n=1 Tax=unclassified Brevundimonas TaxID=2622653 RepID=UPI0025C7334B|nr:MULTISPECIES: hypothetical protein [unclassified Brevundimonas]
MDEFDVAPAEGFAPTQALERMLRLLLVLFDEVQEYRRDLILNDSPDVLAYHLDEAFVAGLKQARDDTREMIRRLQQVDFSLAENDDLGLSGPILRFKMMAIKVALYEANAVHPYRGRDVRRGWPLYRRDLLSIFTSIDGPMSALTQVLEGPRGPLDFQRGLASLICLKSGPAA